MKLKYLEDNENITNILEIKNYIIININNIHKKYEKIIDIKTLEYIKLDFFGDNMKIIQFNKFSEYISIKCKNDNYNYSLEMNDIKNLKIIELYLLENNNKIFFGIQIFKNIISVQIDRFTTKMFNINTFKEIKLDCVKYYEQIGDIHEFNNIIIIKINDEYLNFANRYTGYYKMINCKTFKEIKPIFLKNNEKIKLIREYNNIIAIKINDFFIMISNKTFKKIKLDFIKNNEIITNITEYEYIITININLTYFKIIDNKNFKEIKLDFIKNNDKINYVFVYDFFVDLTINYKYSKIIDNKIFKELKLDNLKENDVITISSFQEFDNFIVLEINKHYKMININNFREIQLDFLKINEKVTGFEEYNNIIGLVININYIKIIEKKFIRK